MPAPRTGTCIFCDDVRPEVGNKISLMGIYSRDILFTSAPPAIIPKLGIVTWLIFDWDDPPDKLIMRINGPGQQEIAKLEANAEGNPLLPEPPEEGMTKRILRSIIQMTNLPITQEGLIEVFVDTERESFRAGRARVRFNVKPEELGLPAGLV
jgi:hypothetical protein